jgi:hypothetical protein
MAMWSGVTRVRTHDAACLPALVTITAREFAPDLFIISGPQYNAGRRYGPVPAPRRLARSDEQGLPRPIGTTVSSSLVGYP